MCGLNRLLLENRAVERDRANAMTNLSRGQGLGFLQLVRKPQDNELSRANSGNTNFNDHLAF